MTTPKKKSAGNLDLLPRKENSLILQKYSSVDELFDKILGVERILLIDRQ